MEYKSVLYRTEGRLARITFSRPEKLNALSLDMEDEFLDALVQADADDEVRVIVLNAAGRSFCSGYDMSSTFIPDTPKSRRMLPTMLPDESGMELGEYLRAWRKNDLDITKTQFAISDCRKPVIAAVQGYCFGGGMFIALSCDITIAAENAVFGVPELRHISNTHFVLVGLAGWKNAMRYSLSGDHVDAQEAYRINWVNEVVPTERLEEHTLKLAKRFAMIPLETLELNKAIIRRGFDIMGYRAAMMHWPELGVLSHCSYRSDPRQKLKEATERGGMREYIKVRDEPFRPEPFGPFSENPRAPKP
ncbi:enoyl-CoA hydratase/isomerase family protein [Chloroflexota bacterium]